MHRSQWPVIAGGVAAVLVVAGIAAAFWPPATIKPSSAPPPRVRPGLPSQKPALLVTSPAAPLLPKGIPSPSANLLVAIGDPVAKVQASYGIKADLADSDQLSAPLDGLMFFFNPGNKTVREIRADAPFGGSIDGVHIGDTLDRIIAQLGQPMRSPWKLAGNTAYLFRVGGHRLRCDIDPSGKVATILVFS